MNNGIVSVIFDDNSKKTSEGYFFHGKEVPSLNGILRFTPDQSSSTRNFSKLREEHAQLQLDSVNKTSDRE